MTIPKEALERLAKGLTDNPRKALLAWSEVGAGKEWPEIVGDGRGHSYHSTVKPLLRRGLVQLVRDAKFLPETETWIQKLFALTPLGLALRSHLIEQETGYA